MPKSPNPPRTMKRRRFVTLAAWSGAAVLAAPLSRAAAAVARRATADTGRRRVLTPAIRREIEKQEKALSEQIQIVRSYKLPPGSPMAFVFEPLRARRRR